MKDLQNKWIFFLIRHFYDLNEENTNHEYKALKDMHEF